MKLLFATDLHGSGRLYQQIVSLAVAEQPQVIALGGDLFKNKKPWAHDAHSQRLAVENGFADWLRQLDERVRGTQVILIPGNHDWLHAMTGVDELERSGLRVHCIHQRSHVLDDVCFIGYGCTPPSVFPTKDFERWDQTPGDTRTGCGKTGYVTDPASEEGRGVKVDFRSELDGKPTMAQELAQLPAAEPDSLLTVFISHSPPWDTGLDHMWGERPIGSVAVLEHLRSRSPDISLHGHVHEAPEVTGRYRCQVGDTLAVNPGRSDTGLAAAIFDTDDPAGTLRHTLLGQQ